MNKSKRQTVFDIGSMNIHNEIFISLILTDFWTSIVICKSFYLNNSNDSILFFINMSGW